MLGAFQFHEKALVRHGQVCGLHFTLSGPRAVQYSAICDVARHTILFYDSNGERLHRSELAVIAESLEALPLFIAPHGLRTSNQFEDN